MESRVLCFYNRDRNHFVQLFFQWDATFFPLVSAHILFPPLGGHSFSLAKVLVRAQLSVLLTFSALYGKQTLWAWKSSPLLSWSQAQHWPSSTLLQKKFIKCIGYIKMTIPVKIHVGAAYGWVRNHSLIHSFTTPCIKTLYLIVPTLPTMQIDGCQFGHRFGGVMLVGANVPLSC